MKNPKSSISRRLGTARIALNNAQSDAEIGPLLAAYGYDAARLAEGMAILETADSAVQAQVSTAGGWQTTTQTLGSAEREARTAYRTLREVVRAAYGYNAPILAILGLNQTMPARQTHFLTMAWTLFNNAISSADISATLERFGYNGRRLTSEKEKVGAMETALEARESSKGSAQQATMAQRSAMNDLGKWMSAFFRVAKVALRGQEQLLEKLGILARNARTQAQRQAPAKAAQTRKARREGLALVAPKEVPDTAVA
jgi:hypothetical protein